jgi:cardiolipin synthase
MILIVEPDDGLAPILEAVRKARKSIEIMIFRFDRPELERALATALDRGVSVRALIAHTNSEGERGLRKLELRLLDAGLTVTRTNDDLVRYHSKYLVVDRRRVFVLGFNFTAIDIRRSRSFGLEVRKPSMVQDILRLFEADAARHDYTPSSSDVIVSPVNARTRLSAFISGARKQLLIYDPKLSDLRMIALLHERIKAGVDVRVIGSVGKAGSAIPAVRLAKRRLHVRAIVRDGSRAFVGSQSLRRLELDQRRELGLVVRAASVVKQITTCFESDWAASVRAAREDAAKLPQPVLAAVEQQEAATLA